MNDQRINIAIAKSMGAKLEYIDGNGIDDSLWCYPNGDALWEPIDCCNDLNLMHHVENTLGKIEVNMWKEYIQHLRQVVRHPDLSNIIHASARQRAEAYLKTINKWEEE